MRIRTKVNKRINWKTIEKVNEIKKWFFEKIDKIDKTLSRLKRLILLTNISNERGKLTLQIQQI